MKAVARPLWLLFGVLALVLGAAGTVLPLLPTTPFVLLAAFCFARSSPRLHDWLLSHRLFGPLIENWRRHGAIDRRTKIVSLSVMAATPAVTWMVGAPLWALAAQFLVLAGAATFIATRPEGEARPVREPPF